MSDPQQARIEAAAEAAAKEYRSHALRITDGGNNPTGEQIGCSCGAVFGGSFKAGKDHLHRTIATAVLAAADRVDPLRQPKRPKPSRRRNRVTEPGDDLLARLLESVQKARPSDEPV